jgi:hypothetical protein
MASSSLTCENLPRVVPRGGSRVQAWRVDEQAETYLRLLAEAELRRAGDRLRDLDAAVGTDVGSNPGMALSAAEDALGKVVRAGRILFVAGVLERLVLLGPRRGSH